MEWTLIVLAVVMLLYVFGREMRTLDREVVPEPPANREPRRDATLPLTNYEKLLQDRCPTCDAVGQIHAGPEAGMMVNVRCANCNSRWNVGPYLNYCEPIKEC